MNSVTIAFSGGGVDAAAAIEEKELPDYFSNLDLETVVTPINVTRFESLLRQSRYPEDKIKFLVDGFSHGFDIEYGGPTNRQETAENLPLTLGSKTELWNKVMKEVKARRYAGPYQDPPYDNYIQSPIGLVPKAGNKTRLIFHLSFKLKSGMGSVNGNTPTDLCKVKYNDLDHAINNCVRLLNDDELLNDGNQQTVIYYSKSDLLSAFRILPLSGKCYKWLLMKAEDPLTGKNIFLCRKESTLRCEY